MWTATQDIHLDNRPQIDRTAGVFRVGRCFALGM